MPYHGKRAPVVIGAGLSGLAAARALHGLGYPPEVLEACPEPGGLTRTTVVGGFCFDYTGHLLHLAKHENPASLPFAGQRDADWQRVERRSYCYVGGTLVPAPIQYHIGDLPSPLREACIASYHAREADAPSERMTFHDFIVRGFGRYLADLFLIPQNEKTLAIPIDRLTQDAVRRFFPLPDDGRVLSGMTPASNSPPEYNSRFWYPKQGGIARLVRGLAKGVRRLRLSSGVAELDLPEQSLRTVTGDTLRWDLLLSSMPLADLCRISEDPDLRTLGAGLTHSTTLCINLGIRGSLWADMRDAQWIYVPDRSIPFYRVGAYSQISNGVCPPDHSSVYVEVGVPAEEADRPGLMADLESSACEALYALGWVRRESVVWRVTQKLQCAYVHLTPERDQIVPEILERLERHRVFPIGRYGRWDYTSMEDSILSGIETARLVAG